MIPYMKCILLSDFCDQKNKNCENLKKFNYKVLHKTIKTSSVTVSYGLQFRRTKF